MTVPCTPSKDGWLSCEDSAAAAGSGEFAGELTSAFLSVRFIRTLLSRPLGYQSSRCVSHCQLSQFRTDVKVNTGVTSLATQRSTLPQALRGGCGHSDRIARVIKEDRERGSYFFSNSVSTARTCALCSAGFTSSKTRAILPSGVMRNVLRAAWVNPTWVSVPYSSETL